MFEIWKSVFKKSDSDSGNKAILGGPPSAAQCEATHAVFGDSIPEIAKLCGSKIDYATLGKQAYKAISNEIGLDDILDNLKIVIAGLQEGILEFDEYRAKVESEKFEKSFFTSRETKALYGDNWPTRTKTAPQTAKNGASSGNWIDDAVHQMGKNKVATPQTRNVYSAHDLRMGKTRI